MGSRSLLDMRGGDYCERYVGSEMRLKVKDLQKHLEGLNPEAEVWVGTRKKGMFNLRVVNGVKRAASAMTVFLFYDPDKNTQDAN